MKSNPINELLGCGGIRRRVRIAESVPRTARPAIHYNLHGECAQYEIEKVLADFVDCPLKIVDFVDGNGNKFWSIVGE